MTNKINICGYGTVDSYCQRNIFYLEGSKKIIFFFLFICLGTKKIQFVFFFLFFKEEEEEKKFKFLFLLGIFARRKQ